MKAEDLRIGNWIKQAFGYCQVRGTAKNAIWLNDEGGPVLIDSFMLIEPIPITEDILLKCGFYQKNNLFILKDITLQLINCGTEIDNHLGFVLLGFNNEIKYVHQLQNLYFALTGEELIIEL